MPISHKDCGHSHIHLPATTERSFGCQKHLGENRHKQAIPAATSRASTDRTRNETWTSRNTARPRVVPPPYSGSHTMDPFERAVQCRLIPEATPGSDEGKR